MVVTMVTVKLRIVRRTLSTKSLPRKVEYRYIGGTILFIMSPLRFDGDTHKWE